MPMIEFNWDPQKLTDEQAIKIGGKLENMLREAITDVREDTPAEYGVTVEGRPFGPITHNQPDLLIIIFYHEGWNFTDEELGRLPKEMGGYLKLALLTAEISGIVTKIRFYERAGHASETIK